MRRLALLLLPLLALSGCGGDGDDTTTTVTAQSGKPLTKSEYIARADAICQRGRESTAGLFQELEQAGSSVTTGEDADHVADLLREAADQGTRVYDDLKALTPPRGDAEIIDNYLSTGFGAVVLLDNLADAYDSEDSEQISPLQSEIRTEALKAEGIAQGYGFKVCGATN
jgi:hypothetical protein